MGRFWPTDICQMGPHRSTVGPSGQRQQSGGAAVPRHAGLVMRAAAVQEMVAVQENFSGA